MSYTKDLNGIFKPLTAVAHREDEYPEAGFDILKRMQADHFWYIGRHRFLLNAVQIHTDTNSDLAAIDMGGGCGGWIRYLLENAPSLYNELALADSSMLALQAAQDVIGESTHRYQIDLLNLDWNERWDNVFLLDVIEHIPDHVEALKEVAKSLKPGGLVFITVPALKVFWSFSDELSEHQRRYSKADFSALAVKTGMELLDARYFMFFLSPLYWLSRLKRIPANLSAEDKLEIQNKMSRIPHPIVNTLLSAVFSAETPIGHHLAFPWGTSLLGIFRKPR
ncbi:methyltransferase domain-containing protein [Hoeflea sp. EC-HK425]|uniref:class I SAM-dependent methyltransferase n=1 Tax=Hoeflea sp. EC-HK425 TaxID=2038388 RepID=UPI00125373CF|nr:methyltransferase domain-containing protein [Hoeflea sp. EC-HK425]VVT29549.1 Methyltransferase [Hoeflea sp. EC-HK425]